MSCLQPDSQELKMEKRKKAQFEGKGNASLPDEASMGLNLARCQECDISTSAWKVTQKGKGWWQHISVRKPLMYPFLLLYVKQLLRS